MAKQEDKKGRKPKGRKLSEKLAEKQRKRAEADALSQEDGSREDGAEQDAADEDEAERDDADFPMLDMSQEEERDEDEDEDERDEDDAADDDDRGDDDESDDDEEDEDDLAAAQMGHQRYVIAGFFALWMVTAYIGGRALEGMWSQFAARDWFVEALPALAAVPHEGELMSRATLSLVAGALLAAIIVYRYYVKPEVRTWADEVAEELMKVKWPTRKEVSNNTVVVMIASAIITVYLTLLDRFWGFVTNLIYSSGT